MKALADLHVTGKGAVTSDGDILDKPGLVSSVTVQKVLRTEIIYQQTSSV
jgi:hypothetical protein